MTRIDSLGRARREEPTDQERKGKPETQRPEGQDAEALTTAGASARRTAKHAGRSARAQRSRSDKGAARGATRLEQARAVDPGRADEVVVGARNYDRSKGRTRQVRPFSSYTTEPGVQ